MADFRQKGIKLEDSGSLDEALNMYKLAIKYDPKDTDSMIYASGIMNEKKQYDEAIKFVE